MDFLQFGYTTKWIKYGFINQAILDAQIAEYKKSGNKAVEHYRKTLFDDWLDSKKAVTNQQIEEYLELALEDGDALMAGTAVRNLFTSPIITEEQFEFMKERLPQFGDWTLKLITREVLSKRLKSEKLSLDLLNDCMQYKIDFKDNRLVFDIIRSTENITFLSIFETNGSGKQIRTLAQKKIDKINREANA